MAIWLLMLEEVEYVLSGVAFLLAKEVIPFLARLGKQFDVGRVDIEIETLVGEDADGFEHGGDELAVESLFDWLKLLKPPARCQPRAILSQR